MWDAFDRGPDETDASTYVLCDDDCRSRLSKLASAMVNAGISVQDMRDLLQHIDAMKSSDVHCAVTYL